MSVAKQGKSSWNKGRAWTESERQKLSSAHLGKRFSQTTKDKLSAAMKGKNHWNWQGGISGQWLKQHPERAVVYKNVRRGRLGGGGSFTAKEWELLKLEYNNMCLCCKRFEPEIKLTVDHVIPISKGGSTDIGNIQPLCGSCNSQKYTSTFDFRSIINVDTN